MRPYITLSYLGTHYFVLTVVNKGMGNEGAKMKMKKVLRRKLSCFNMLKYAMRLQLRVFRTSTEFSCY